MFPAIIASLFVLAILLVLWFSYYIKIHDYMLILVINLISAWLSVNRGMSSEAATKWLGFEFFTMFLFWSVIKQRRRHWRNRALWVSWAVLLVLHVAGFVLLLRRVTHLELIWFPVVSIVEFVLLSAILDRRFPNAPVDNRAAQETPP